MRFIRDIYAAAVAGGRPVFSYEFFTPRTIEGERALFDKVLPALARFGPGYCSVTYGAGGSTQGKTIEMVQRIQSEFRIPAMAHITCVGSTRSQISAVLADAKGRGIQNILALRGDPPAGDASFVPPEGGFQNAHELVTLARETGGVCIGVAGFPEGHIECKEGKLTDWRHLKAKIDCGADFVITQLFFDNAFFLEFRDHLTQKLGVTVPIIPGVIPILSASQIRKFTQLCGATLPPRLRERLTALENDDAGAAEFGVELATQQCTSLLREGVPGVHFYTLNKSSSAARILQNLGQSYESRPLC